MAFVYSRGNILFRSQDGTKFMLKKDEIGSVPDWVAKSAYFDALVRAGKIVVTEGKKDSTIEAEIKLGEAQDKAQAEAVTAEAQEEKPKRRTKK